MTDTIEMPDSDASYGILIDGSHMSVDAAAHMMVHYINAHPSLVSDRHYRSSDIHGFFASESKHHKADSVGNETKTADALDEMIWYVDRIIDSLNDHDSLAWFIEDNSLFRMNSDDLGY